MYQKLELVDLLASTESFQRAIEMLGSASPFREALVALQNEIVKLPDDNSKIMINGASTKLVGIMLLDTSTEQKRQAIETFKKEASWLSVKVPTSFNRWLGCVARVVRSALIACLCGAVCGLILGAVGFLVSGPLAPVIVSILGIVGGLIGLYFSNKIEMRFFNTQRQSPETSYFVDPKVPHNQVVQRVVDAATESLPLSDDPPLSDDLRAGFSAVA